MVGLNEHLYLYFWDLFYNSFNYIVNIGLKESLYVSTKF